MRKSYRRFNELRENAKEKLKGYGIIEDQLTNAVIEISMMNQSEIPEYKLLNVKSIISSALIIVLKNELDCSWCLIIMLDFKLEFFSTIFLAEVIAILSVSLAINDQSYS